MDAPAYRWREGHLEPIHHTHHVRLDDLLGVERQKQILLQNIRQFVAGHP
ncbi:MAG: DUF815 domain-containing protein, partial [Algiphilus sp.]